MKNLRLSHVALTILAAAAASLAAACNDGGGGQAPPGGGAGGGGQEVDPPPNGPTSGDKNGGCDCDTLGHAVPNNACVQNKADEKWYQCNKGTWAPRWSDHSDCSSVSPLGKDNTGGPPISTDISDLMQYSSGSTASKVTPMGTHFEAASALVLTAQQQQYLNDAAQSPADPGSAPGLHLQTFRVVLYPSGTPSPADVNQHAIGDCDGDSAMASMAYVAPSYILKLISDHQDGTFGVAMYDPMANPIEVNVDSKFLVDASGVLQAATARDNSADWATVLEKAVMKYNEVYKIVGDVGGIGSEFLTPMFTGTGDSFGFDRGVLTPQQIERVLRASLAAGKFVTGGFGTVRSLGKDETVTGHGYAMFVPPSGTVMAAMRNPWGVSATTQAGVYDPSADGVLNIPSDLTWAKDMDVRVIEPGAAAGVGVTQPFTPPAP